MSRALGGKRKRYMNKGYFTVSNERGKQRRPGRGEAEVHHSHLVEQAVLFGLPGLVGRRRGQLEGPSEVVAHSKGCAGRAATHRRRESSDLVCLAGVTAHEWSILLGDGTR